MTEITQADRDAAARAWAEDNDEPLDCHICEQIRAGYGDNSLDVIRFARHRIEERAAIVAWLRDRKEVTAFYIDYVETAQAADAIEAGEHLNRSILSPKPDPLVEVLEEVWGDTHLSFTPEAGDFLRAALAKRGGRIVFDD